MNQDSNSLSREPYIETFDNGPGGWVANNTEPLPVWDSVAYCYGPWYLDANHAPPGGGYLHLLMHLHTKKEHCGSPLEQDNRFIRQRQSRDLTNARLSVRLRGQMDAQGAQLVLLAQTEGPNNTWPRRNFVLTGQPFEITPDWSDQTVTLVPDPAQWPCLGARHDLTKYGCCDIAEALADVSVDLIFVLFPLKIEPITPVADPHKQWAGKDYQVYQKSLPKGLVMFDTVRIDYPQL
jgi:hypothetical protein